MRILLDMNLSPDWVEVLSAAGHNAVHWSQVGSATATDSEIMAWARTQQHVVLTHDLDFGALLHATRAQAPSVVQLRAEDIRPQSAVAIVLEALQTTASDLQTGALVTITPQRHRIRLLPLRPS